MPIEPKICITAILGYIPFISIAILSDEKFGRKKLTANLQYEHY